MARKKGKQGGRRVSSDSSSSFLTQNSFTMYNSSGLDETSLMSNKSLCEEEELPQKFIVVLNNSTDHDNKYLKCIKSSLENVIFLHPFILRLYNFSSYMLIKGEGKHVLCKPYPLRSVKKNNIVFPKDNFGFELGEVITLHPYERKVKDAAEISFSFNEKLKGNFVSDFVLRLISNRFLYLGMTLNFKIFDSEYSFTIKEITCDSETSDPVADELSKLCSKINLEDSDNFEMTYEKSYMHSKSFNHNEFGKSEDIFPEYYATSYKTILKDITDVSSQEMKIAMPSFFTIGGLDPQLNFIKVCLNMFLNIDKHCDSPLYGTLVLHGPPGTGKSLVLNAVCNEYNIHAEKIMWYNIYAKTQSEAKNELKRAFQRAVIRAPSIIIMDEFNFLCPSKNNATSFHKQIASTLSVLVKTLHENKVFIMAAVNSSEYNDEVLKAPGRVLEKVKFHVPTALERFEIFKKLMKMKMHDLTLEEMQDCADCSHGFTGRDLFEAVDSAQMLASSRVASNSSTSGDLHSEVIKFSDVKMSLQLKKPSIVLSDDFKVKKVYWEDIGGMKDVKEKLRQLVEWPLKYPEAFKRFNITPSRGVLMFGPPGCSKTMIAKALATECQLNFISKNASELFDKYVGESEKTVRHLFAMARAKSPCIIFLDEIDALVAERGSSSGGSGVGDRIVTTLLTEIDGIEELQGVIIIAATNRPDMLDDALMRNGRINHFIYVPLPDLKTREDILKIQMKRRNISEDFDFKYLAEKTEGYTGAEIVNICNEAAFQLLYEDPEAKCTVFTQHHFDKALESILPRTSKETQQFYESFNSKYCSR